MDLSEFLYDLPGDAVAQAAIEPRHDSRLLDTRDMGDHRFRDLPRLLTPGDLLVVNETRVRAARLIGKRRRTGGRIELLLLEKTGDGRWQALAKPARRLRPGVEIEFDGLSAVVRAEPADGVVVVELDTEDESAIEKAGQVPLPPYFTGELVDRSRYQTVFAKSFGSAAAPTAGLHFTDRLLKDLVKGGVGMATVDLHVSMDTFRPITAERIEDHQMHSEWCSVPVATSQAVARARQAGRKVIAVGTTVVRTLESLADGEGGVRSGSKTTDLFIRPGFEFKVVDTLITNFHMPGSSLLVLLASFMGSRWSQAYQTAIDRGYRFLSFGDAMLADRSRT